MGIVNPTKSSVEFSASTNITENLTRIIYNQEADFSNYNIDEVKTSIARVKIEKEERFSRELQEIREMVDDKMRRVLDLSKEKKSRTA